MPASCVSTGWQTILTFKRILVQNRNDFASQVDAFMVTEMERLFSRVPGARRLADPRIPLEDAYYIRHRVETVKRIWLTSQTDALALAAMVDEDYEAARWWSKYIYQELNHDLLYLADLQKHGYTLAQVAVIPAYASTRAMVAYIRSQIKEIGAMAAVAYSVWVEWNSDKTSGIVVERAKEKYSSAHVKGSHAHVHIDINEDHYAIMIDVMHKLIQRRGGDALPFFNMLYRLTDFVASYFDELEAETMLKASA